MNLSHFSLMKEDADSYTVGHPKGKSLTIPKKGLSDTAQLLISRLKKHQNYAEGGEVDDNSRSPSGSFDDVKNGLSFDSPQKNEPNKSTDLGPSDYLDIINEHRAQQGYVKLGDKATPAQAPMQAFAAPEGAQADQGTAATSQAQVQPTELEKMNQQMAQIQANPVPIPTDPVQQLQMQNDKLNAPKDQSLPAQLEQLQKIDRIYNPPPPTPTEQAMQQIKGGVDATNRSGLQQQRIANQVGNDINRLAKTAGQNFKDFQAQDQNLQDAFMSKSIDPDRYWNKYDTPSKIATAVNMIVSGFGAGITGQENLAVKFLMKSIDDDVESQKNEQGKALTLWKLNRDMHKDKSQADLTTSNMLLNAAKAKIMAAQAGALGPQAAQGAAQALLEIQQKEAQNNMMRSLLAPHQPGTEAEHMANMQAMQQMNPHYAKQMEDKTIPGVGTTAIPPSQSQKDSLIRLETFKKEINDARNFLDNPELGMTGAWHVPGGKLGAAGAGALAGATAGSIVPGIGTLIGGLAGGATGAITGGESDLYKLARKKRLDLIFRLKNLTEDGTLPLAEFGTGEERILDLGSARTTSNKQMLDDLHNQVQQAQSSIKQGLGVMPFNKDNRALQWLQQNPNSPDAPVVRKQLGLQ